MNMNKWNVMYLLMVLCMGMSFSQEKGSEECPPLVSDGLVREIGVQKVLLIQRNALDPSHVYTYHQENLKPGGGLWVWKMNEKGEPVISRIVDSEKGIIMDANLHYDGNTVLFSWKRTMDDFFQLYTVDIDGKNLKKVTENPSNNFNACWVPDGGIVFLSDRKPAFAYCWKTTTPILWRCEADGSRPKRISSNYLNDFTPSIMEDGRILFSRWEYVDRPGIPIQSLWSILPDGTMLTGVFGNRVLCPATFMDARAIPKSDNKIICVMTSHNGPCRGAIGIINTAFGSNAQKGITNLTPEINIGEVDKTDGNWIRGPYENPYPIDDKWFLVSKAGRIELRDYEGKNKFLVQQPAGLGFYSPQPVRERKKERLIPSTLPPDEPREGQKWATIYMQNVYIGLEGYVKQGEIEKLAIVQDMEKPLGIDPSKRAFGFQFPVVSAGATFAPKKVWGYAKVEKDGSAHFKVPAEVPVYFLPLDREGRAVQRMRTFTHLMPGEKQGCIGCHDDRNTLNIKLEKRSMASLREVEELTPPPWGVGGFHYPKDIQPVWDKNCVTCHNADKPSGGVELTGDKTDFFNVSYDVLVRKGSDSEPYMDDTYGRYGEFRYSPYTRWAPSYNGQESTVLLIKPGEWGALASKLAYLVRDGHKDMKGNARISLSDAEKRIVYAWIDLNVPYYQTSNANYKERTGCRHLVTKEMYAVFEDISNRRCVSCHTQKWNNNMATYPNNFFIRMDYPERNPVMRAPLAKEHGGTQKCGAAVFKDKNDPDYQALLKCFDKVQEELKTRPRMDMILADPALEADVVKPNL